MPQTSGFQEMLETRSDGCSNHLSLRRHSSMNPIIRRRPEESVERLGILKNAPIPTELTLSCGLRSAIVLSVRLNTNCVG